MADIASKRIKHNGERFLPGQEVTGLSAKERKRLREGGAIAKGMSQEDVAKVEAYQKRVEAAQTAVEEAEEALAEAERTLEAADTPERTASAEADRDAARALVAETQARLKAIAG